MLDVHRRLDGMEHRRQLCCGGDGGLRDASASLRACPWARRTAWPERRSHAPSEAPVSRSTPTTSVVTPTIVAPVAPSSAEKSRSSSRPTQPPFAPSVSISPKALTARPVRNGRTSTSALRATISAPTQTSATGST